MIAYIEGKLVEPCPAALVMVGGIGLQVMVPESAAGSMPPPGENVGLWTHLAVREDAWTLYGFPRLVERDLFRLLISVNGVGPKLGLAMLSAAGAEQLARMLGSGDEKGLARLPGIGPKSAARLVIELSTKVPPELLSPRSGPDQEPAAAAGEPSQLHAAREVLAAMGLKNSRADKALDAALERDPELAEDLEGWVRAALKVLG